LPRRFYLKPATDKSVSSRPTYSVWFIPVLVIAGAMLGMVAYRMTCSQRPLPVRIARESATQSVTPHVTRPDTTPVVVSTPVTSQAAEVKDETPVTRAVSFDGLRLQVLNGCGVKGLARIITPGLRAQGFDVRETRNASHFRHEHSALIDRTGDLAMARAVADSLGIHPSRVSSEMAENLADIDLTLIVGADYQQLKVNLNRSTQE